MRAARASWDGAKNSWPRASAAASRRPSRTSRPTSSGWSPADWAKSSRLSRRGRTSAVLTARGDWLGRPRAGRAGRRPGAVLIGAGSPTRCSSVPPGVEVGYPAQLLEQLPLPLAQLLGHHDPDLRVQVARRPPRVGEPAALETEPSPRGGAGGDRDLGLAPRAVHGHLGPE